MLKIEEIASRLDDVKKVKLWTDQRPERLSKFDPSLRSLGHRLIGCDEQSKQLPHPAMYAESRQSAQSLTLLSHAALILRRSDRQRRPPRRGRPGNVRVHSQHRERLSLPFADGDPKTAEVLSNVLLLARDREIQDLNLLDQVLARR